MHRLTRAATFALAAAALSLAGCETTGSQAKTDECCGETTDGACCQEGQSATLSAANQACPVTGKPVRADGQTVSFQGQEVGFCCGGCEAKFTAMTDEAKAAALTH